MLPMDVEHPELGYIFHSYPSGASLGYVQLDVFLVPAGADEGFAAAQLILSAWENNGSSGISKLVLTVQWPGADTVHVAPGLVTIASHGGGEQAAFCFGGTLHCEHAPNCLTCRLTSSAPILNLGEEGIDWSENVVLRVVDGLESEIAACRARTNGAVVNGAHAGSFDQRLAHTDPRLLYAVGLTLAEHSFSMLPDIMRTEHYWEEHNVLTRALHEAQTSEWWPADVSLAAVLAPPAA